MGEYRWVFIGKDENYESLLGPDDRVVCTITEPEDRTGRRDLRAVAAELNRLERERDAARLALGICWETLKAGGTKPPDELDLDAAAAAFVLEYVRRREAIDEWKARAETAEAALKSYLDNTATTRVNGAAEERGKVVEYLRRRAQWLHREYLDGVAPGAHEREAECKSLVELIAKGRHEDPRHLGDPG